jgi:hypothetical protein
MPGPTNTFVRDSLADNGSTPNNGALNVSPDIIPQLVPANPGQVQALFGTATYGQDIAQQEGINIKKGQSNYIYMRAKNPTGSAALVQLSLYWSMASTLQLPATWISQQIAQSQQFTIPANSVMAAPEPFIWSPLQLPAQGHYCLISQVTWSGHPGITSATTFPNVNAWWQYCRDNNTVAQRNIEVVNPQPGTRTEWNLDLLGGDPTPVLHTLLATCNVPAGSTVALFCPSAQLNPPISTGPVTITGTNNNQNVIAASMYPANFQGTLQVIFQSPATVQPGAYSIVLTQYAATQGGQNNRLGSYTFDINIGLSQEERKAIIMERNNLIYSQSLY